MKRTTSTQGDSNGSTPTRYDIQVTICANRLEFLRTGEGASVSRQAIHRVLDDWLDHMRTTGDLSGEARLL